MRYRINQSHGLTIRNLKTSRGRMISGRGTQPGFPTTRRCTVVAPLTKYDAKCFIQRKRNVPDARVKSSAEMNGDLITPQALGCLQQVQGILAQMPGKFEMAIYLVFSMQVR